MKNISFRRIQKDIAPGSRVIRYHLNETPAEGGFGLVASRHGIMLEGASGIISRIEDLDVLAKHVAKAWQEFEALKREQGLTLSEKVSNSVNQGLARERRGQDVQGSASPQGGSGGAGERDVGGSGEPLQETEKA